MEESIVIGVPVRGIMAISLSEFITQLGANPVLRITVLLILGVIMINGWTDAPNAIASVVATGGMRLGEAVRMAAVCNFLGLTVMAAVNAEVASTVYHIADFGENGTEALAALCAAMTSIILWSAAAWCFGLPTSESHALLAGLTGAAAALHHGFAGIRMQEWGKVLCGLAVSVILGFLFGWLGGKAVREPGKKVKPSVVKAQIAGAAAMAFMHGAQDGQKFMGVFLLGLFLAGGKGAAAVSGFAVPFWMMCLCSVVMAAGTLVGGERIIRTVGTDMVELKGIQGAVADGAGAFCLLLCSLAGIPVSTTHVKTTAILGVGMAERGNAVNRGIVRQMFAAWMITFPCCGIIGYLTAGAFLHIIQP